MELSTFSKSDGSQQIKIYPSEEAIFTGKFIH